MSTYTSRQVLHDATSYVVPISNYDTQGLCKKYILRRHKWEAEANAACHEARLDWTKYIGSSEEFGGANPTNGNFTATALPLIKPERLGLVAYTVECMEPAQS
jgi:ophiobolin F synthase